jgi:hypothetical protein
MLEENDMRTRAWRRRQQARIKARIAAWPWVACEDLAADPIWLGKMVQTPHPCSGMCCGNPRKWWGEMTRQERRKADDAAEQMSEIKYIHYRRA